MKPWGGVEKVEVTLIKEEVANGRGWREAVVVGRGGGGVRGKGKRVGTG